MKKILSIVLLSLFLCSCGTVSPSVRDTTVSSFSGNEMNSGLIEVTAEGALITPDAYDYYSALIKDYGKYTIPATPAGFQAVKLESGNFMLTLEALSRFKELKIIADDRKINRAGTLLDKVGVGQ